MKKNGFKKTSSYASWGYIVCGFLSVIQVQVVWGDNVIYSDTSPDSLQTAPSWLLPSTATPTETGAVLFPGSTTAWTPSGSTVTIDYTLGSKQDPSYVVGGLDSSNDSQVQNNVVTINTGNVTNSVYGGISRFSSSTGRVTNNQVVINRGTVGVEVIGGSADGWGSLIQVTDNHVTLNANAVVNGAVKGGYGYGNSTIPGYVSVDNNTVEVNGGEVRGDIHGGSATGSQQSVSEITANQNTVILNGANIINGSGIITGGLVEHAGQSNNSTSSANANKVFINGGNLYVSAIYAGSVSAQFAEAINNTVEIKGDPAFSQTALYGGWFNSNYTPTSLDVFTGNTLNVYADKPISVGNVGNFQNYNFKLEPSLANSSTALMTADNISFGNNSTNDSSYVAGDNTTYKLSNVNVVGVNSGNILQANDKFILAQDNSGNIDAGKVSLGIGGTGVNTGISQVQQGISLLYNVKTEVIGNQIVTTVQPSAGTGSVASVNPQLKALMEGRLAAAMLVTRGGDNIAYNLSSFLSDPAFVNGFTPFVDIRTDSSRYNSGSHINADEHLLTAGLAYKYNNLSSAIAYEQGWGSYDSHNSFYTGKVHGTGHNEYYGMAMLGRYSFENGLYADASFRFGRLKNKFNSSDIVNIAAGEYARYTIKSGYQSAHLGTGYVYKINERQRLDLSVKYLWTRTPDANKTIAGDNIHFDSLNSHRLRFNAEGTQQLNQSVSVSLGLGFENEFDGKQGGRTYETFGIKKASVKGGTAIASLAMNYRPKQVKNLSIKTELQGYTGKREGGGIALTASYSF